jgi:hypothetical protein
VPVIVEIGGSASGGVGTLVDQGMPTAPANAWPVEITNGAGTIIGTPANPISTTFAQPSSSTVTAVAQSIVTVTILSTNLSRKGAIVYNHITAGFLYLKQGPACTTADFTIKLAPGHAYELPFPVYTGQITGIWSSAGGGAAQVTESQ